MCDPISAAYVGVAALSIYGEREQAKGQVEFQEAQARAANIAASRQQEALTHQATQATAQATESVTQERLAAAQEISAARVSAGESGITGTGVNRLVQSLGIQQAQQEGVSQRNLRTTISDINVNKESIHSGLSSRLQELSTPVKSPGLLDSALRLGSAAFAGRATASSAGFTGPMADGSEFSYIDYTKNLLLDPSKAVNPGQSRAAARAAQTGKTLSTSDTLNLIKGS